MQFEVEQKHRIDMDEAMLFARLSEHGATFGQPFEQADEYFAHPCRDFAATDEALRIRTEATRRFITYKGAKLDQKTKTRREIEIPLATADQDAASFSELLAALGFSPVGVVRKTRRPFHIRYADCDIEGAYDIVGQLGSFVELELRTVQAGLDAARAIIVELSEQLELGAVERRSYLEMLLERQSGGAK